MLHCQDIFSRYNHTLAAGLVNPVVLRLYVRKSGWLNDVLSGRRRHTPAPDGFVSCLAELSPLIRYEVHDAYQSDVSHSPTWVVDGPKSRGLRFLGTPTGHELNAFIDAIVAASKADSGLDPDLRRLLAQIHRPLSIKVFSQPWCPFCPSISATAHRFAVENPNISVQTIDAAAFPRMAKCHGIQAFPSVVINNRLAFSGPKTVRHFAQTLLSFANQDATFNNLPGADSPDR